MGSYRSLLSFPSTSSLLRHRALCLHYVASIFKAGLPAKSLKIEQQSRRTASLCTILAVFFGFCLLRIRTVNNSVVTVHVLHRKEVIQPHLPIRLPCYDLTPIIEPTFDCCLLAVSSQASGVFNFHGLTGGVYKARERIHRGMLIRDY